MADTHLEEARECLPAELPEKHVSGVRYQAALLASGAATKETSGIDGSTATLDAAGFKSVTSLCCPPEMEVFFTRLLSSTGLQVCSILVSCVACSNIGHCCVHLRMCACVIA